MQRKIAVEMAEKEAENREKARRIIQKRTIVEEFSEKTVIDLEEWKRRENERNAFGDHERDRVSEGLMAGIDLDSETENMSCFVKIGIELLGILYAILVDP